jgi:hypothetical protein
MARTRRQGADGAGGAAGLLSACIGSSRRRPRTHLAPTCPPSSSCQALEHFASLGFDAPPGLDDADFLSIVASPCDHGALLAAAATAAAPPADHPSAAIVAAGGTTNGASAESSAAHVTRGAATSALSFAHHGGGSGAQAAEGGVRGVMTAAELSRAFWASKSGQDLQVGRLQGRKQKKSGTVYIYIL